jgi:hypothetical protein
MLDLILKLYSTTMQTGVTSPLPHLFGPPGCGKSTSVRQAADLIGVKMHTVNVSRISPLELEGVQMPITSEEQVKLKLLHATFWTQLNEGDILLLDEFLRGFPEVYNGLLDILTAREVGGYKLPNVFIIAASNSMVAYDKALEDRLLHLPVTDARKSAPERTRIAEMLVSSIGLMPEMTTSMEMSDLIDNEVLPMYEIMDHLRKRSPGVVLDGHSPRNLIGQALMREVQVTRLADLLDMNNIRAINDGKKQFVVIHRITKNETYTVEDADKLLANPRVTGIQRTNTSINRELLEAHRIRTERS